MNSPAGQSLKVLRESNQKVVAQTPDWLPIKFSPINVVERKAAFTNDYYTVSASWTRSGTESEMKAALWKQLKVKRPDLDSAHIETVNMTLDYTTDMDELWYSTSWHFSPSSASGLIPFDNKKQLGEVVYKSLPVAGSVKLQSITWRLPKLYTPLRKSPPLVAQYKEESRIPFVGDAKVPISVHIERSETQEVVKLRLVWKIDGVQNDFQTRLVPLLKDEVDLKNRTIESLSGQLRYFDASGKPLSKPTEKITIRISDPQGEVQLKLVDSKALERVELELLNVTWVGRQEIIEMK